MKKRAEQNEKLHGQKHAKVLIDIIIASLIAFLIIFFFFGIIFFLIPDNSTTFQNLSGYNCLSGHNFTCSLNISYSKTGQISLNISQKIVYPAIYNIAFICVGDNTGITNVTKPSGILNTTNSTMPYKVKVHVSDIQCYNRTGPVYVGPKTKFHGVLYVSFNPSNETGFSTLAATIVINGNG